MASNNLFGGLGNLGGALGGLMGGLAKSGLVPKDTPDGKLLAAQSELADLQKQEAELLQEIGQKAYAQNPTAWPQDSKLKLLRQNMAAAQKVLDEANAEKEAEQAAKDAQTAALTCPQCSHVNPEGTKFCQECGSKLGAPSKSFCTSCGAELSPGTRFCGECGARQES
jgi:ribosomal protein L40E